jgi:predicted DsbA family dithiol-disulfide isomerase
MTTKPRVPLKIDIVSDVVCPWCVIGYLHLQQALERMPAAFDITLRWHPFELNPTMPPGGENLRDHLQRKYGARAGNSRGTRERLEQLGEAAGFRFDYFDQMRVVNTFRAHQLLHWAGEHSAQTELALALFRAFFSERRDVSSTPVLVDIAVAVGLPGDEAVALLEAERLASTVRKQQQIWLERDVMAVPAFFFEDSYPLPGAQDPVTFESVLRRIYDRKTAPQTD